MSYWRIDKRTYNAWRAMRERCNSVNHDFAMYYSERGISYPDEWDVFEKFVEDVGLAPNGQWLDRIDPSKSYSKENCRWVTPSESNANRRFKKGPCGYRGVYQRPSGRYAAHLRRGGKNICLGTYDTPRDAAKAYDKAIVERFGEVAMTNLRLGWLK